MFDKSQTVQCLDSNLAHYEHQSLHQRKIQSEHFGRHLGDANSEMMVAFQHLQHEVAFTPCVWGVRYNSVSWQWRGSAA